MLDKESMFYMSADQLDDLKPLKEIFDLTGKTAVVTGTVGLALHVINRLGELGAQVVFAGRTEEWGRLTEETMKEQGYQVSFFKCDVSDPKECYALADYAEKTYGPVDIVVPVAATWNARAFVDMKHEEFMKCLNVDLVGQYFTVQAAVRSMIRGKRKGKVVTISSVAYRGDDQPKMAMMTAYNAAKGGVVGMTKGIAKELKQYGINVNCVAPGGMLTPGAMGNLEGPAKLYGKEWSQDVATNGAVTPVCSTPDEIARMIVVMCTDISDFMYGQIIEVNGGSELSFQEKPWSYTMEGGIPGPEKSDKKRNKEEDLWQSHQKVN